MLADGDVIQKLAELKARDKSLWEKIKSFIVDLVAKIKGVYEGLSPDSVEGRYVSEMLGATTNLKTLFTGALVDAGESYANIPEPFGSEDNIQYSDRNKGSGYGAFREALAKQALDELSKKMGSYFPLSASFDSTMLADNTPLAMETIAENSVVMVKGKSAYSTGSDAFKKAYGSKARVHIKQMGIDVELYRSVAKESINKAINRTTLQATLDVIPHLSVILENSKLFAVERINHTSNKGTSLFGYRLYNLYWYEEVVEETDSNGEIEKKNKKTPHCLVCTVVQNTEKAEGYVFRDIENVTINHSLPTSKSDMSESVNSDIYTIAQLYRFVKRLNREDGGIKYSAKDRTTYSFHYTKRNDGVSYSDRAPDSVSNRSLLAGALESVAQNDIERKKLEEYRGIIALIDAEQEKLAEVKARANEIRFTKGRTSEETKRMRELDLEANQIANRIATYDRKLLTLESTKALKGVLEREKKAAYKKAEQKGKEALASLREKAVEDQRNLAEQPRESDYSAIIT